jgi:hypothetical protein
MSEINPLIFGAAVIAFVALLVIVPRIIEMRRRPKAHDMYFGDLEPTESWVRPAEPEQAAALGAPRALSPLSVRAAANEEPASMEQVDTRR